MTPAPRDSSAGPAPVGHEAATPVGTIRSRVARTRSGLVGAADDALTG
ncbi:hypothetical protein ACNAW0_16650 [Micromonospora sp. SL1-18]